MRKLFSILACTVAAVAVLASCKPKVVPDAKCELTAFSLSGGVTATIDATSTPKTILVIVPTSVTGDTFTPSFTATEFDTVTIDGTPVTSGETSVRITNGSKVVITDEVSGMSTEYVIVVKANDEAAELTAVSFKAADNSLLDEDVTPDAIASEMVVRVPGSAFRQELTVTVEAGLNDEIKVNNTVVESGSSIKVDTSFPIDITVTDAIAGTTANYVLKVGKILQYVVTKLGEYAEGSMNDFTMKINPSNNMPYFAYVRKLEGESNNGISVARWNGSAFEMVGNTGIADVSSRSASKPMVAFAKDGSVYLKYLAGDVASKPTVKKFNGEWASVGIAGFTPQNCNSTYYSAFFIHPSNDKPTLFWTGNSRNTDSYRTMAVSLFDGSEWASKVVTGTIPAYGSGSTSSSGNYYKSQYVVTDSKAFIASSFNEFGYYVHEVNADGSLTTIVDNYLPEGAPHGLPDNLQFQLGPNDALYVMGAVRTSDGGYMQIYKVDQDAKTLKAYGAASPHITISANGGISQKYGFGVSPVDGLAVIAFNDSESTAFGYLDDNLQWSYFNIYPQDATSPFFVEFDKDGNGYIAYQNSSSAIALYKVALEEDILPE